MRSVSERISLFNLPRLDMTFCEAADYARANGYAAIEPYPHAEFAQPDLEAAKRVRDVARAQGVRIRCFSMLADLASADPMPEIERLKRYADVAATLGCIYFHHTLAPNAIYDASEESFAAMLPGLADAAREVYDSAFALGLQPVYEDQGMAVNGVARFGAFLDALGRDAGVVADLGNILFVDESPVDFVRAYLPRVRHVHVKDYLCAQDTDEVRDETWLTTAHGHALRGTIIGHGDVPYRRVIEMLESGGYEGDYTIEFEGLEDRWLAGRLARENLHRTLLCARKE